MDSLGQYLRSQRTTRAMSLEELSARTRIRLQTLEALERDDYAALPAEVTVKGFLRSYARCLDLNERDVLARYEQCAAEQFRGAHPEDPVGRVPRSAASQTWQHKLTLLGLAAAGFMVLISGVVALSPRVEPDPPTAITAPASMPPLVVPSEQPPADSPAALPNPQPLRPSPTPAPAMPESTPPQDADKTQQLVVKANETSWVQVIIDDGETKEALLQPGERVGWSAARQFRLTVGNAGGVTVEFNGEALPELGPVGKVRTLVLPRVAMSAASVRTPEAVPTAPAPPSPPAAPPSPALTSPPDSTTVPPHQTP